MKAIGYIRVSTGAQTEGFSLPEQKASIQKRAYAEDLELVGILEDGGISGTKLDDERPGYQALKEKIREGKVEVLIVKSLSRLFRSSREALDFLKDFIKEYDLKVISLNEKIDTTGAMGEFFYTIVCALFELEIALIKERMESGKREALSLGKWPYGKSARPYGYDWDKEAGRFEVVEEEAEGVKRMFELILTGHTLSRTEAILTAEHIPTRSRKPKWANGTVKHIIRNVLYSRPKAYVEGGKPIEAPQLMSVEDQDRAIALVERLTAPYKGRGASAPRTDSLLSHMLSCRKCGKPMIFKHSRHGKIYYVCDGRIKDKKNCDQPYVPVEKADSLIWKEVTTYLLTDPAVWAKDWKETKDEKAVILTRKEKAAKVLAKVQSKLDRAAEAILGSPGGNLTKTIERKAKDLETQYQDITAELRHLDQDLKEIEREEKNVDGVKNWPTGILIKLNEADNVTKRDFLRQLFKGKIFVDWPRLEGDLTKGGFNYKTPFDPHGLCIENAEGWLKEHGMIEPLITEPLAKLPKRLVGKRPFDNA